MAIKEQSRRRCAIVTLSICIIFPIAMSLHMLLLLLTATSSAAPAALATPNPPSPQHLQTTSNGTFQISIFEDLHFGEAENTLWGPQQDTNTTRVMNAILSHESQQLVVLNGDLITGENTFLENSTAYIDAVVRPLVQRNIPWASTYGNHDSDVNISREGIFAREKRYRNCLTGSMVNGSSAGVSNYYIPVHHNSETDNNGSVGSGVSSTPALLLYFFDSRGGNFFQKTDGAGNAVAQDDWVDQSVVDWFTATQSSLLKRYGGKVIPSLAFVHIPINAMLAFQSEGGVDANEEPGINDDVPLAAQGGVEDQGTATDGSEYEGQDRAFMEALVGTEGLMAVFSGHDHGDSWCQRWDGQLPGLNITGNGLNLCFGQHSGYGGYGSWIRGSRQILIQEDKQEVETWIRLEDGSISGKVTLNATYGQDKYPAVENKDSYGGTL